MKAEAHSTLPVAFHNGNCALVLAEKGVSHRQPHIAVHGYLAGVLHVQVEMHFLPCSLDDKTIGVQATKAF